MSTTNILDLNNRIDELRYADNIMLSDGVTSVEDALDEVSEKQITYIEHDVSALNIASAWGSLFAGNAIIGISSLGLQTPPTIVCAVFVPNGGGTAWVVVNGVSVTAIDCSLLRALSGTVTGKLIIGYRR